MGEGIWAARSDGWEEGVPRAGSRGGEREGSNWPRAGRESGGWGKGRGLGRASELVG